MRWQRQGMLHNEENRLRPMHIKPSKNVIIENLLFKNAAYWTFWAEQCDGLIAVGGGSAMDEAIQIKICAEQANQDKCSRGPRPSRTS